MTSSCHSYCTGTNTARIKSCAEYTIYVFLLLQVTDIIDYVSRHHSVLSSCNGYNIKYRTATSADVSLAREILLQQAMNPFSIEEANMLVAYDADEIDDGISGVVGFGQIRSIGTGSSTKLKYSELASLYVEPSYRRRGIGSMIIQQLIERYYDNNQQSELNNNDVSGSAICLLTLRTTASLYERHDFVVMPMDSKDFQQLPKSIRLEATVGRILSGFLGNDLICMVRNSSN
jgi:GNAT superfamily N-acetyltransferase